MRDGWVETTLGEVASWSSGKNISKDSRVVDGEFAIVGANGEIGRTNKFLYNQPLVVVGRVGSCGETYLIHEKVWISDNALIALPNTKIDITYLYYLLKSFDYNKIISGTTQPLITQGKLKIQSVLLPPFPEQKRIVDLISSVDSYIEALQQQLWSAKRSRSAVLHELLTAGGDDWEDSSLGQLLTLEYGKPLTDENRDGKGFPVFASAGVVGLHSEPLVSKSPVIVVGRKGTAGSVYWSEIPCFVIDTAYFVKQISDIDSRFLYLLLNFIDLKSVTAQTGVPGLNRERAYSLRCNVPPKSKQLEIVNLISLFDGDIAQTVRVIDEAKQLRSGLLSDLLSGDHEIPASYDKVIGAA